MKILTVVLLSSTALFAVQGGVQKHASHAKAAEPELPPARAAGSCKSVDGLPDVKCTPGAVRTTSIQSICNGGSTTQYRPPTSYTDKLKVQQIEEYGYSDTKTADYEEDHLMKRTT